MPFILQSMDAARPFLCQCRAAMDGNMEMKMNSKSKVVFWAAFAAALCVVPISSYAAQHRQAKEASAKAPAYNPTGRIQTGTAENFQNHFTIDY
jgi:hypothetical protein